MVAFFTIQTFELLKYLPNNFIIYAISKCIYIRLYKKYFYRQSEGKYLIFRIHKFLRAIFETEKSLSVIDVTHKLCYFTFNFIDITLL